MIIVRWVALPWVIFQFVVYENPYPRGYEALGWILIALLALGNGVLHLLHRGPRGRSSARAIAVAGLVLDIAVITGMVWLYTFDQESALWAIVFILPLEGAITFQLAGALAAWGGSALIYIAREIYGSERFDYALQINSITYRMGIGLIIGLVAGLMARDLMRQRTLLREAVTELKRVDQLRSALISTLGHDVRSPLTVIRGSIETVLARFDRLKPEDRTSLLTSADRQARRLEALATDLLDLARLEAGRLDLQIVDLRVGEVVRSALSYIDAGANFEVSVEPDLVARADPQRLEQILHNLAANAVRHGEPPFTIEAGRADGQVEIRVVDHGPGVSESALPHLFEPFHAHATGSVGYGLAIVKALIEAQGGTVDYGPNRPTGSRFCVTIPATA